MPCGPLTRGPLPLLGGCGVGRAPPGAAIPFTHPAPTKKPRPSATARMRGMGIRLLLCRSASARAGAGADRAAREVPPWVPAFAAAASTGRIPATLTTAMRHATADLRRHVADRWRPTGSTVSTGLTGSPGFQGSADLNGSVEPKGSVGLKGSAGYNSTAGAPAARPPTPALTTQPSAWRLWAELARGYLTLVLALLPRSRPAPTLTVFIATTDTLSALPDGSAPHRRRRDPQGREPGATP
ncbi:hypothetical protein GCM10027072_38240 [Streptomyces bullii]